MTRHEWQAWWDEANGWLNSLPPEEAMAALLRFTKAMAAAHDVLGRTALFGLCSFIEDVMTSTSGR